MKKFYVLLVSLVLISLVAINLYVGQIYENDNSGQILSEEQDVTGFILAGLQIWKAGERKTYGEYNFGYWLVIPDMTSVLSMD